LLGEQDGAASRRDTRCRPTTKKLDDTVRLVNLSSAAARLITLGRFPYPGHAPSTRTAAAPRGTVTPVAAFLRPAVDVVVARPQTDTQRVGDPQSGERIPP
jgi:hypothetical protein